MKLVWDKPTKSFRQSFFLSSSSIFPLFSPSSPVPSTLPIVFHLFTPICTLLLVHLHFSICKFSSLFLFREFEQGREREKEEGRRVTRSPLDSLRFPYPILPSRKMKLLLSPLFLLLSPIYLSPPPFPLGSFQTLFKGRQVRSTDSSLRPFFPPPFFFFLPPQILVL